MSNSFIICLLVFTLFKRNFNPVMIPVKGESPGPPEGVHEFPRIREISKLLEGLFWRQGTLLNYNVWPATIWKVLLFLW